MDAPSTLTRTEVDATQGPLVLEFGAGWCGICRAAQPLIADARNAHREVRYVKIEDGPGKPLGRSFGVKLWPTLVFLRDGREVARLVRPHSADPVWQAFEQITERES
jgi:thioredoxin 1